MTIPHPLNDTADWNSPTTLYIKSMAGEVKRRLFLILGLQLKRDEIVSHFSAFGKVKNVRICAFKAFVEFTQAESVTKALESDSHTIAGRRVEVSVADDDRPHDETTFWDLNDDCIHEILSMECLSALDLCSVAETSRRLKDIAGRVFRRKYAKCVIGSCAIREVKSAQRILRNFGAVISGLAFLGRFYEDYGSNVLDSVAEHCNTLESLNLRECVIPDNFAAKSRPIFSSLRQLKIEYCTFEGASKELFADCGSLVELELSGGNYPAMVKHTFPKLKKFKCECDYTTADEINLHSFILRHKNLTSISMHVYDRMPSLLQLLGDNCKQLEELEFILHGDQTFDLSNFGHLRKLNIDCYYKNVVEVVRGWNNLQFLEHLTLNRPNDDTELMQPLSQLKRLQVLILWHYDGLDIWNHIGDLNQITELEIQSYGSVYLDVVLLIKSLSNLKALRVNESEFKMDLETYLRIVDVVRARPDKLKLTFQLNNNRPPHYDNDMLHNFSLNADVVEMIVENWFFL